MTNEIVERAARELVAARTEHRLIQRLPESSRPETDEDALAIQLRIAELLAENIAGWKCSTPRGEHVFLAPLLDSTVRSGPRCPLIPHNGIARFEPEIAFIIGRDLSPRETPYTEMEVRDAIAEARLVLEIIGSRYVNPDALPFVEFLADSINNQGLTLGPKVENVFVRQLETLRIIVSNSSEILVTHNGRHPNTHPLRPLFWLANFLASRGQALKTGAVVTTGSYAGILEAPLETPLTVKYGDLGELEVTFVQNQAEPERSRFSS